MEGLIFLTTILVIVFLIYIAMQFKEIAKMKGFLESKYFWISFLFPICGYLLVIALPDRNQKEVKVTMTTTDMPVKQTIRFESDELPDL